MQHTAIHCNTLQHTIEHYSTLQHTLAHSTKDFPITAIVLRIRVPTNSFTHTHKNTNTPAHTHAHTRAHTQVHALPAHAHPAALCSTLQHTATHCGILQHTAAHCNTRAAHARPFPWTLSHQHIKRANAPGQHE